MAIAFLRRALTETRNKFHARGTYDNGVWFASAGENRRWHELQLLQRAGHISGLARQVAFPLSAYTPRGERRKIGKYVADFVYRERHGDGDLAPWPVVVEDYKGFATDLYLWKRKHLEAEYDVTLRETR